MYTLIKMQRFDMERNLYFRNTETGRVDKVFDTNEHTMFRLDPITREKKMLLDNIDNLAGGNFSFLKIGDNYDCKLMLCGRRVDKNSSEAKCFHYISREMIGLVETIKTEQEGNIYYVSTNGLGKECNNEDLYIEVTRIDLVEVNGVVHQEFVDEILSKYS